MIARTRTRDREDAMDELLTIAEVAAELRVHPRRVREWLLRGELPGVRFPPTRPKALWRVRRSVLQAWLEEKISDEAQLSISTGNE